MLAQGRCRVAQSARCHRQAGGHIVHRQLSHLRVGKVDEDLASDHVRVGHELVDVVDGCGGDLGSPKDCHVLGEGARRDKSDNRRLAGLGIANPVGVGAKPRVGKHVLAADRAKQPLGHRLDRGGDADIAPVPGTKDVARRGRLRPAAGALADFPGQPVDRRLGGDEREQRVEQWQIDNLAFTAFGLDLAQCHQHRHRAIEAGDHVGECGRRQCRLAVGKAGARGIARHALDQGAKAGTVAVGPVLPPPRDPDDDQAGIVLV